MLIAESGIVLVTGAIVMLSMAMIGVGNKKNINLWAGMLFYQMALMHKDSQKESQENSNQS